MGIYGLTTFIRKRLHAEAKVNNNTTTSPSTLPTFQSNFDLVAHAATSEKPLVILVDALSVLPRVDSYGDFESCLKATTLPDYFFLHDSIRRLYQIFSENNIELMFYFDTPTGEHRLKKETLMSRKDQDIGALIDVQDAICGLKRLENVSDLGAPLWGIQCHVSLNSLGARIVNCIGEADYQLARDGKHAFAIISEDSDCSIMQGTRWIPYSTIKILEEQHHPSHPPSLHRKHKITCSVTTPEAISGWLELPVEHLADFATLVGNDYTKPILRETERGADFVAKVVVASNFSLPRTSSDVDLSGIDSASHHRTPNIELIARALSTEEGRAKFEELLLLPDWTELRDITEFNRRFYTGRVLALSPELEKMCLLAEKMVTLQVLQASGQLVDGVATAGEYQEIQQYYYGLQVLRKIKEGTLPPSSFGIWFSGQHLGSIRPEYIDDADVGGYPSSDQLSLKLLAATSLLMGREHIQNGQRVGVSYEILQVDTQSELPHFLPPSAFPPTVPGETMFSRACLAAVPEGTELNINKWELLAYALHPFPSLLQTNPKDTRLIILPDELSSSLKTAVLICRHLIGASFECGKPIELSVIENIMKSVILLHSKAVELGFTTSTTRRRSLLKKVKLSKASLPLISISTYFQVIHSRFIYLMQILGLRQPFFVDAHSGIFSCSTFIFHPSLFVYASQRGADFVFNPTSPAMQEFLAEWEITDFDFNSASQQLTSSMNSIVSVFDPKVFAPPVITAPVPLPRETTPPPTPVPSSVSTPPQSDLPISEHLAIIAAQIRRQQVAVIQGATGCGKSSRVPQAIYRDAQARGERVKIIITQPRRVAATSLARRVAQEMGEPVGQTVGFKVMGNTQADKSTSILYVTLGWLLAKLTYKPESFSHYTHLILDEIHERGLDADILYVLVKKLLHNPGMYHPTIEESQLASVPPPTAPKIILMSATCNAEEFAKYFAPDDPPDTVVIGKNPFPVEVFYLDQLLSHSVMRDKIPYSKQSLLRLAKQSNKLMLLDSADLYRLLVEVVKAIALAHRTQEGGNCVLVFLAGIQDIEDAIEEFDALLPPEIQPFIQQHVLHSMLEEEDSAAVFSPIESGITRVVLSTNIAESSVTLPGVRYVIDFGTHKEVAYNEQFQCEALMKRLISKSSAQQRRGRAGRLFPGTIFRFYSEEVFEMEMSPFEEPEILRVSLSSAVLRLKSNFRKSPVLSDVEQILSETMVPPERRSVQLAFDELLKIGALQYTVTEEPSYKDTAASPLGVFLSTLAVDVKLGRMIAYGFLFQNYLVHTIVMVASLSSPNVFMKPMPLSVASSYRDYNYRISSVIKARINFDCGVHSDCISTLRMFASSLKTKEFMRWCFAHGIHSKRMIGLWSRVRELSKAVLNLLPSRSPFVGPIRDLLELVTTRSSPTHRKAHWIVKLFNTIYDCPDDIDNLKFILTMSLSHNLLQTLDARGKGKKKDKTLRLQTHGLNSQFDERRTTLLAAPLSLTHTHDLATKLFAELLSSGPNNFKVSLPSTIQTRSDKKTGIPMTMLALEFSDSDKVIPNGALARVPTAMRTLLSLPKNGDILLDDPTPQRSYFSSTGVPDKKTQDAEEQALFITSITTKYEALNWRMNGSNQVKLSGPTRTAFVDLSLVEGGYSGPLYAIASTLLKVGSILLAENVTILPCTSQSSLTSLFLLISAGIELQNPSHLTTMVEVIRGYAAGTTKSNVVVDWVVSIGKAKPLPCAVSSAALPLAIEMAEFIKEFLRSDFFDQEPHRRGAPSRSDPSIERSASLTRLLGQIQGFKEFLSPSKTRELKQNPPPIQAPPPITSNDNGNVQALLVATPTSLDRDAEIITSYKGESPHVTQSLLIRCNAETGLIGEKVASVCMSTFDDLVAYVKHVASQHGTCPICNHPISSLVGKEKMKHMKRCFKKLKIIRCKACDRNFTERKALFDHFIKKHAALWQQAKKNNNNGNPNLFDINQPLVKPREPEPDAWSTTLVSKPDDILKSLIPGSAIPLNATPAPSGTLINVAVALSTPALPSPAKKKELPPLDTELDPKTLVLTVRCPFCEFVSVNDNTFLNHAIKAHKNCAICREPFLSHLSPQEIRKHVQTCWRKLKAFKCPYCDRAGLQEAKFLQGHIELHHKDILHGGGAVDVPDSWEDLEAVANVPKATAKKQPPKKKATPPRFASAVPASKTAKLPPPFKVVVPASASFSASTSFVPVPPAQLPPTAQELEKEIIKNITKALSDLPVTNGPGTSSSAGLLASPLVPFAPTSTPSSSLSSSSSSGVQQKPVKVKNQFKPKKPKAPKAPKAKGAKAAPGGATNGTNGGPNPKLAVPKPPKKHVGNGVVPPPAKATPKQ